MTYEKGINSHRSQGVFVGHRLCADLDGTYYTFFTGVLSKKFFRN